MPLPHRLRLASAESDGPGVTLVDKWVGIDVNSNSWSVSNRNFGDTVVGGLSRHLIAVVTCQDAGSTSADAAFTFGVTIGGLPATLYNTGTGGQQGSYEAVNGGVVIAIVEENSLASGTIAVTLSGFTPVMNHYAFALYRAVGLSSTVPASQPTTSTLTVPSNGFGVMGAVDASNLFGILGAFTGVGAETAYFGPAGAAMLRTAAGSATHTSDNASIYRGATWKFI